MRYFYYVVNEGSFTMAKAGRFKDKSELLIDTLNSSSGVVIFIEELSKLEWLKLREKFDK